MQHNEYMGTNINRYFKEASGEASYRDMGEASGINYSTIRRQLTGEGDLTAGVVVALARTYKRNVLEALVTAGFITQQEAEAPSVREALAAATDVDLAEEILKRAQEGTAGSALTDPIAPVLVGGFGDNTHPAETHAHAADETDESGEDIY